ncbi:MAG: hypothetical protein COX57_00160 [Alphaproteobacteria bacterium CG_4_10_14_0_2_um_filter_63_37]|nr:MAG: hypothetical protein AUJ55_00895 [Proteobacteria bacterium CG1_02_64_396]PJA26069.1 MAG: hypothetical protein COX57_00160 [Alphaproteobacteria bacterium CG_4_10_14_0_2_um_filter_63_37]
MIDLFVKGGPVMWPLLLFSLVAVAVILERGWSLRRGQVIPSDALSNLENLLDAQGVAAARNFARERSEPIFRVLETALQHAGHGREVIKEAVEEVGRREAAGLERYLNALGTVAASSPLLGLLGTVTGMIKVFTVISVQGVGDPAVLAAGISEALITTATGLTIAIPALVAHRYFEGLVEKYTVEMEGHTVYILDLLGEKRGG